MAMSQRKLASLAAKAAAFLNQDVETIKEQMTQSYTARDQMIESQSILYYYEYRVSQLTQGNKESDKDFTARQRQWKYKICKECETEFAYSYTYEDVGFCSLDCIANALKKIGMTFDYSKPLTQRWGYHHHPAVVPAPALRVVEDLLSARFDTTYESPGLLTLPIPLPE